MNPWYLVVLSWAAVGVLWVTHWLEHRPTADQREVDRLAHRDRRCHAGASDVPTTKAGQ